MQKYFISLSPPNHYRIHVAGCNGLSDDERRYFERLGCFLSDEDAKMFAEGQGHSEVQICPCCQRMHES